MKRIIFLASLLLLMFGISETKAQERGIGVSPAAIEIEQNVEWPYTVPLLVTNFSSETENFEVLFEKNNAAVTAIPGRFSLEAGATERILVTFDKPLFPMAGGTIEGLVKVVSKKSSGEGFTAGTGVKIPFTIETPHTRKFLAGGSSNWEDLNLHFLLGSGMVIVSIILLWYIADIVRVWVFNSNKR